MEVQQKTEDSRAASLLGLSAGERLERVRGRAIGTSRPQLTVEEIYGAQPVIAVKATWTTRRRKRSPPAAWSERKVSTYSKLMERLPAAVTAFCRSVAESKTADLR